MTTQKALPIAERRFMFIGPNTYGRLYELQRRGRVWIAFAVSCRTERRRLNDRILAASTLDAIRAKATEDYCGHLEAHAKLQAKGGFTGTAAKLRRIARELKANRGSE